MRISLRWRARKWGSLYTNVRMHDPRINTFAAIGIVLLFGLFALGMIERAITDIDWTYTSLEDMSLLNP